jgi:hypothetical protein
MEVSPTHASVAAGTSALLTSSLHLHVHKWVIVDCSVCVDQEDKFTQFLGQIATLITNGKIVNQFFVINPVIVGSGKKDLKEVRDIPQNMTALGGHIKILKNSVWAFEKKSVFGSHAKKGGTNAYMDTVYLALAISCDVEPSGLFAGITAEWMRAGGIGLYIKEIAAFDMVSPLVIFYLCNTVNTNTIAAELKKILEIGIQLLEDQEMGDNDTWIAKVPPFAMRKNLPKRPGLDPTIYNSHTNRQWALRRAWHVEMEKQHVRDFACLVKVYKEFNVFAFWGEHVRIMEVVENDSP